MATILISRTLSLSDFEKLNQIWGDEDNVELTFPEELSDDEVQELFRFLLSTLPNEFAFCVLENLAEDERIPMNLLTELFAHGDTGCNVTICLKDNLSEDLAALCLSSDDKEVREHFLSKRGR